MVAALFLAAVLWQAPGPIRVPDGETRTVEAPAISGPARLVFRVRADYRRPAGSNPLLRVRVGGRAVGAMRDRRTARLVGDPERDGRPRFDRGCWRVPQGPAGGDELALDVSDLVSSRAPFAIAFASAGPGTLGATPLVIDEVRLEAGGSARTFASPPPDRRPPRLAPVRPPTFAVDATADALRLAWGGAVHTVRTVVIGGPHRVARRIERFADHVTVLDTFSNDGSDVIGLRVRHAFATDSARIHLGGRLDPDVADAYSPWNPTVFAAFGDRDGKDGGGLGLVAEDDVLRQQLYVDFERADDTVGIRTDMLCLAPRQSYTIAWSAYPRAASDYWDFINAVRAAWGVNRSVQGSFVWFTADAVLAMPSDRLATALARQGTAIAAMFGGWVDPERRERPPTIGFGTAVLGGAFAAYRSRIAEAVRRLQAARPGIVTLAYFDAQRDSSPDAARRFADSLLLERDGRPERVDWGGRFSPAWGMVPTTGDSFGTAMLDVARAMGSLLGADGLYWDEMDGVDFRAPRLTIGTWDGNTCILGDDGAVAVQVGLANLLSQSAKLGYAAAAGSAGVVLGNVPPTTRAFQDRSDLRMVEAQGDRAPWGPMAHLTTPLAYVGDRGDFATARAKIDEGLVPVTSGFDVAHDMTARLFPFTPEYLQPGTLRARERIVTTQAGTHGWQACAGDVRAFRYDAVGREHVADWRVKRRAGGAYVRVRLGGGEAAIIECGAAASAAPATGSGAANARHGVARRAH
ncbi:MAG: hypothetical protein B6D46_05970 [Polyangiaceae bacterium UTPRO1]|jgi:hypothetical protein|nr:MAG: hypothetical protein B6D46_05970 [Polyangiaceae bacterium UTPRO1]